jgi:hypothetical protein
LALRAVQTSDRIDAAGVRRLELARRVGIRDGDVDARSLQGRFGVGQVGFGLGQRSLIIPGIDADQHVARLHILLVGGQHLHHVAANARADRVDVPVHLSVVGGFERIEILPRVITADSENRDD